MRLHESAPPQPTSPGALLGRDLVGPLEVTVAAGVGAPATARAAVTAWISGHVSEAMLTDAQLLVGELVANSVRHADAPADATIRVRAHVRVNALYLAVEDRGNGGSITRRAPDLEDGGGFGLNVVEVLSRRWGVNRDAGTRVWAELAFPEAA
jgi:anti-sigma regulatory factor (Ser/Thr protein kinase)